MTAVRWPLLIYLSRLPIPVVTLTWLIVSGRQPIASIWVMIAPAAPPPRTLPWPVGYGRRSWQRAAPPGLHGRRRGILRRKTCLQLVGNSQSSGVYKKHDDLDRPEGRGQDP